MSRRSPERRTHVQWRRCALVVAHAGALLALAVTSSAAHAAAPPTVHTGEANGLTASGAILHGSVFPANQTTSYFFEYGPTTAYDAQTPTTLAGGGTRNLFVAAPIGALVPATTYHYRLVATNATGTTFGADRTFDTKRIPLVLHAAPRAAVVVAGQPVSVTGELLGTGAAGRAVVLQADPFPYVAGFRQIGTPALTDAAGAFSFSIGGLSRNTRLRVATVAAPLVTTTPFTELVAVRVSLHARPAGKPGYVRLSGIVAPAAPQARVSFRVLRRGRPPLVVGTTRVRSSAATGSRFSGVVRLTRPGLYDAYVQVVATGSLVSHQSAPISIR
jgi:hypothetical protein